MKRAEGVHLRRREVEPGLRFDRVQLNAYFSVGLVLLVVGVLVVVFGPTGSFPPFRSVIVTRLVGAVAIVGGAEAVASTGSMMLRSRQAPIEIDPSGLLLRAVAFRQKRIEWGEIVSMRATQYGVFVKRRKGRRVKIYFQVLTIDGTKATSQKILDYLTSERTAQSSN